MSYNSKDRTSYVYRTLKSQNANVKVLENSSHEDLMFVSEDTIDLGRANLGTGGFYDYILNNITEEFQFYGIFNNDIFNISDNFIEEHLANFGEEVGIIHSQLDDQIFKIRQIQYLLTSNNCSSSYSFVENVIPFYNYKLLKHYSNLLTKPIKQHFYGCMDIILSNISNEIGLQNIIINNCIASHERSGVRKSISGNYEDYEKNGTKDYQDFLQRNPNLIIYS